MAFVDMTINGRDIRLYRGDVHAPSKRQMKHISNFIKGRVAGSTLKRKIGRLVQLAVARNFAQKKDSEGASWAPLSEVTQRIRKSLGFAVGPPLIRSKKLFKSATGPQNVSFSSRGLLIQPRSGRFSQDHKYILHNNPTRTSQPNPSGGGDIPGREFYYLDEDDYNVIADIMSADLVKDLNKIARGRSAEGVALSARIRNLSGRARFL